MGENLLAGIATAPNAPGVRKAPPKKSFAQGTTLFPVPLSGGQLNYAAGKVTPLTPIAKTGFLGRLNFHVTGTIQFSTAAAAKYTVPLWRIIQNYTLQNSLNFPFRSLNTDDIWMMMQQNTNAAGGDPMTASAMFSQVDPTITTLQNFSFDFTDEIWHNDHINFSRYLLSAMTTSNDLTINILWNAVLTNLQSGTAVVNPATFTAGIQVSAEFLTVPNPNNYEWPRRNLIQQIIGDPSFNSPRPGLNTVNLTPIQGPEFLGIGLQILDANGVPIPLDYTSPLAEVDILVAGSIPLYQFTGQDLIRRYERMFRRSPAFGYLYIDLSNDLGLVNAMSHTHRKVLSTSKYSQISLNVTLKSPYAGGAGAYINVLKRTQQAYGNNT